MNLIARRYNNINGTLSTLLLLCKISYFIFVYCHSRIIEDIKAIKYQGSEF